MIRNLPSIWLFALFVVFGLALRAAPAFAQPSAEAAFGDQVDLSRMDQIAVHADGRVKSLDSFARTAMQFVSGSRKIEGRTATFMYFDLMLRPEAYADADVIYVKNKPMRAQIVQALREGLRADGEKLSPEMRAELDRRTSDLNARLDRIIDTGLISAQMLMDPRVQHVLQRMSTDLLRSAKFVQMLETAMGVMNPQALRANLHPVPPPGGKKEDSWFTIDEIALPMFEQSLANLEPAPREAAVAQRDQLVAQWSSFTQAWIDQDAGAVNAAANQLAELLPQVNAELYPEQGRLKWESWYFRMHNLTWLWVFYALALVPLLLGIVFRWRAARWIGLLMFFGAFGMHTFAVMLRWYVAQRWPNSNMFEAVTTAAWFGGCLAIILELVLRKSPMRNLFALGSATASMCALMAVHFLPLDLSPNINNMMPVLNDVWLYIHTNVIIFSYCLIAISSVSAILYFYARDLRAVLNLRIRHRIGFSLIIATIVTLLWSAFGDSSKRDLQILWVAATAAGLVVFTLLSRRQYGERLAAQGFRFDGPDSYVRMGGAGSLIMTRPDGTSYLDESRSTFGQVLDGTTMVMMEMSFVLLWTGLCMGAIWADHSWGRPWGWDPKEVFALNTFIIFLLLVHVRLKVKDKGLWTALLAVLGAVVMLFNWIIINFAISGLHSYA